MQGGFLEQGRSQGIFTAGGAHRVEAQGAEHIPGAGLAVVLVSAVSIGPRGVEFLHHLADAGLGLPGLTAVVVQVQHVLDGLVAVGVVAHAHHRHLNNLMDGEAVVAIVILGRHHEHGVHLGVEGILPAHQADKALYVVEHAPGIVQRIAFGEVSSPFEGAEGTAESSVGLTSVHELVLRIEHVAIVQGGLLVRLQLLLVYVQGLAQRIDAPVVVGIFQRTGGIFPNTHVARHVA